MSTYEISKSSLLSLKAEILRKQDELSKVKLQNETKKVIKKKVTPLEVKNKGLEQRELNDINHEEENLFKKSRAALEAKARLYERLSRRVNFTDAEIERNRRFLVRFDRKSKVSDLPPEDDCEMDFNRYPESEEEQYFSDEYEPPKNPDEEWVEYIDCLGRTRKCMRKDLDFLKTKDAELLAAVDKDENKAEQISRTGSCVREINENKVTESSELLSSDMRRELLRQQWEKEEEELRMKNDLHYQDILFNEARTHGVGYYGFSKDEEERFKQQEALKNLRQETQQEQEKAKELRTLREKQLEARAKAARNRKRARMGLPPEEDVPEPTPPVEENKPKEEEVKQTEEKKLEMEKEAARKKHIRPWDIGKKGVKEHYEYTQEEWIDKKRKERPKDFAPPNIYKANSTNEKKRRPEKEINKTLYFSSKKSKSASDSDDDDMNQSSTMKPTLIVNECEENSDEEADRLLRDYKQRKDVDKDRSDTSDRRKGAEIPPPPTFDYYGPSGTKKSKSSFSKGNLSDSISAGLQFLRQQSEKKDSSKKHPSEMFLF
ncbi:hypothetical protein RN001_006878 [Aquatica leii]|uniref:CCDC174 alpha/beta GRSR domain-containing protein n=1 Tax=Aquatica leii TaxID=1421715 RepID=A0AAN7SK43_9COLE|nr:hypothetical protein RN001_006878 [Aquatica leii]